jgi:peptidoglycan hydrolase CwlO-like protein
MRHYTRNAHASRRIASIAKPDFLGATSGHHDRPALKQDSLAAQAATYHEANMEKHANLERNIAVLNGKVDKLLSESKDVAAIGQALNGEVTDWGPTLESAKQFTRKMQSRKSLIDIVLRPARDEMEREGIARKESVYKTACEMSAVDLNALSLDDVRLKVKANVAACKDLVAAVRLRELKEKQMKRAEQAREKAAAKAKAKAAAEAKAAAKAKGSAKAKGKGRAKAKALAADDGSGSSSSATPQGSGSPSSPTGSAVSGSSSSSSTPAASTPKASPVLASPILASNVSQPSSSNASAPAASTPKASPVLASPILAPNTSPPSSPKASAPAASTPKASPPASKKRRLGESVTETPSADVEDYSEEQSNGSAWFTPVPGSSTPAAYEPNPLYTDCRRARRLRSCWEAWSQKEARSQKKKLSERSTSPISE